eukprot:904875-Karenia_brevis.AAC.1
MHEINHNDDYKSNPYVIWLTHATIKQARNLLPHIPKHVGIAIRDHDVSPIGIRVKSEDLKQARMAIPKSMATFYEENAHIVPNATYIVEGMPPHFSPEDM